MRRLVAHVLLTVACIAVSPLDSASQGIQEGDRIRVTAPPVFPAPQTGRLVLLDHTSLILQTGGRRSAAQGGPRQYVIPRNSLSLVEVSRGSRGHGGTGALIGAGIGLAIGLGVTGAGGSSLCQGSGNYGQFCAMLAVGGVLGGGLGGVLVGSAVRSEIWEPTSLGGL